MHAKTRPASPGRRHRPPRYREQTNSSSSLPAPSLAILGFLAALVTDVVGVGVDARPADSKATPSRRTWTPTQAPLAPAAASSCRVVKNGDNGVDGAVVVAVLDDEHDCEKASKGDEAALLLFKDSVSVAVADFLCPGFSRGGDTNQKEQQPPSPPFSLPLRPSPSPLPSAISPWPPSASTSKTVSPPSSPPPAQAALAAGTQPSALPTSGLRKSQPKSGNHSHQGHSDENDSDNTVPSATSSKVESASAHAFANPRPRQSLRPRSPTYLLSGGRHLLAPRDVHTYDQRNIPDRYELGPDGRWYKVTFTTSCAGCHQASQPTDVNDAAGGNSVGGGVVDHDASTETSGTSRTSSSTPTGLSGPHDLSALPSDSSPPDLNPPAGWISRTKTGFYRVPLIVCSSLLLAAAIFGLIYLVLVWRKKRKDGAKKSKKADLERKERGTESEEETEDEGEDGGDGASRRGANSSRRRRRSSRRSRSGSALRERDASASASSVLLTEKDGSRDVELWARATARWKSHVRWVRRRKTGKRSILGGASKARGNETERVECENAENEEGVAVEGASSSAMLDAASTHSSDRGRRSSLAVPTSSSRSSHANRSHSGGSSTSYTRHQIPSSSSSLHSQSSNLSTPPMPTSSSPSAQEHVTTTFSDTSPTISISYAPVSDVPAGSTLCECCGAIAGSSRLVTANVDAGQTESGAIDTALGPDVASPPAYRRRQRRRSRDDANRESMSSESEGDVYGDGREEGRTMRVCTTCAVGTTRHRARRRSQWNDSKRPMDPPTDLDPDGMSPAYRTYAGDGIDDVGAESRARSLAVLHVATDDKHALAKLAALASEPSVGEPDSVEGNGSGLGREGESEGPHAIVRVPEWRDEDVEDVEEYIRREGEASGSGSGSGLTSSYAFPPPPPPVCSTLNMEDDTTSLPPPPPPISISAADLGLSSPLASSSSYSLAPSSPLHYLYPSPSHLPVPSSPYIPYSAEAEEIVHMDGELGPSAPPFGVFEDAQAVPSAPPLFEFGEVEVEEFASAPLDLDSEHAEVVAHNNGG